MLDFVIQGFGGELSIDVDVENNLRENLHQQPRAWFQEVFKDLIIWY